jgi:hypothetical protein
MGSSGVSRRVGKLFMAGCLIIGLCTQSVAETEQRVEVTIQDYAFVLTTQLPLRLGVPTSFRFGMSMGSGMTSARQCSMAYPRKSRAAA